MRLSTLALIGGLGVLSWAGSARAINIDIDYTYDTGNFFGAGNPSGAVAGQQARDALETAADYFSEILTDSFTGISTPPIFNGDFGGMVVWEWSASFSHPTTGASISLVDETILPDQYRVFAGARSLSGSTAGRGGAGGYGWSSTPSGGFTQGEIDQINQITADFSSDVETRGQASGFSAWGGSITFDNDGSTAWSYDHTAAPAGGTADFFSIAIHELAHAVGFGGLDWEAMVGGSFNNYFFPGSASTTEYGSSPPVDNDRSHWAEDTMSTVYGGTATQEVAMDPSILNGTRKLFTALDAAGLTDIGWNLTPPITTLTGDLDSDGFVGITDLNIVLGAWNQSVPPGNALADPSDDGFVGIEDLNIVLGNWNAGTPPTNAAAIPEPAGLALLGLMMPVLWRRRG